MLQVGGVSNVLYRIVEWGISFDGTGAALPIRCELLETGTVFATGTAHVAAGLVEISAPGGTPVSTTYFQVGTSLSMYTATAEGTITGSRVFDVQFVPPTTQYIKQFPLGREPVVDAGAALRIRVTAAAAVNAYCYVVVET
jgi:hypothetical protein